MKKYPKYKTCSIDWVGEIPEHWEVKPLKYLADVMPSNVDKKSQDDESKIFLCNYVDVYKNDFITSEMNFMAATASEAQIEKFTLKQGDVIATKDSEDANDIAIPALVKENFKDVVCGYHLTLMRSKKTELIGDYLFWLIYSKNYNHYFSLEANGVTRYGIGTYSFKNVNIVLPKTAEQTQIAAYLDYKTNQIETLIANKQKLIELLQEERTAIINQAVTKGINPKAKLKPSGIEWLGDVPENWEVKKLKHVTSKIGDGLHGTPNYVDYSDCFFINGNNIGNGKIDLKENPKCVSESEYLDNKKILNSSTILMSINGTIGSLAFYNNELIMLGKSVAYINCLETVNKEFIYYFLESEAAKNFIGGELSGSTIKNLSLFTINNIPFLCPSKTVQVEIVNFIKTEQNRLNIIIKKTEQEIELMKEYKTALISEVVTGKVDVRDEVVI